MNLYHLRYFVTLAHLEHYTKAAERLSITQPSLSHAIASLEKELGVKLFDKEGRNVVLTKYGRAFLEDVEQSLNYLDSSIARMQLTGRGEGTLHIALLRTLSTHLIPQLVRGYMDANPDTEVDFRFHTSTGLTPDILEGLKSRRYDIAFCSKPENEPSIEFIPVARQELVLIVPEGHPLCNVEHIDLSQTLDYPQVGFSRRSGLRPVMDNLFRQYGKEPQYVYELEEDHAVAGMVAAGFGIAVVPNMPVLDYMPLHILKIDSPTWDRLFYMCLLKDVYQAPVVLNFKEYVQKTVKI